ncbi:MAG: mechanosensitive ion channel [Ornithinimicrobium sp.]|uniref:mechanosensitive ion channel family protein n=1 Tax=Ornithinimicrobium sp. TaxID=1977084 RepID=UPI0026DF108C|nr:mechanosensitive ion channel domain-containing protein [Ornithinimicrobium sp.]MDO5740796.1 mechanosensitive ion channel [Ornithinimicrobium sp.]
MSLEALTLPPLTWSGVGLGLLVLAGSFVFAGGVRSVVCRVMTWRGRSPSSARVFGRLAGWLVVSLGIAAALTIVFPSVRPVDVLGGVGIISIAAGIAFQTVLGNMFAGIVILTRDRFRVGDQIGVGDYQGTVAQMGLTSTSVRTFDGRLVLIPNGTLHSQVVTVQTGFEHVRSAITIALADTTNLAHAASVAVEAMNAIPEVLAVPAPEALLQSIGNGTVDLELRFWSGARQLETREAQDAVIGRVLEAFTAHDVVTGSEAYVVEAGPQLLTILQELTGRTDSTLGGTHGSREKSV